MKCSEAGEFVSALCDRERIPREAAEHIGACESCGERLRKYLEIGLELLRIASAEKPEACKAISWEKERQAIPNLWEKGRATMRIPRIAFALMLVAMTALSAGLVLVRAREPQKWFQFQINVGNGEAMVKGAFPTPPSSITENGQSFFVELARGTLVTVVRPLGTNGSSEKMGIKAVWFPGAVDSESIKDQVKRAPERVEWYVPGQKLQVPVEGLGTIEITGQLISQPPEWASEIAKPLVPKEDELRIIAPVALIREKTLVVKINNGGGETSQAAGVIGFNTPDDGWYLVALKPFEGAVEGTAEGSQIQFSADGHSYLLLAGAPITGGNQPKKIWVARNPVYAEAGRLSETMEAQKDHPSLFVAVLKGLFKNSGE
jgi:hypothetical protein